MSVAAHAAYALSPDSTLRHVDADATRSATPRRP